MNTLLTPNTANARKPWVKPEVRTSTLEKRTRGGPGTNGPEANGYIS